MTSNSLSFDPGADSYDATYGFPPGVGEVVAAQIQAAGQLTATQHVLEIGAGTGRVTLPLITETDGTITALDVSHKMLGQLRAKQTIERIHLTQADASYLPYASEAPPLEVVAS